MQSTPPINSKVKAYIKKNKKNIGYVLSGVKCIDSSSKKGPGRINTAALTLKANSEISMGDRYQKIGDSILKVIDQAETERKTPWGWLVSPYLSFFLQTTVAKEISQVKTRLLYDQPKNEIQVKEAVISLRSDTAEVSFSELIQTALTQRKKHDSWSFTNLKQILDNLEKVQDLSQSEQRLLVKIKNFVLLALDYGKQSEDVRAASSCPIGTNIPPELPADYNWMGLNPETNICGVKISPIPTRTPRPQQEIVPSPEVCNNGLDTPISNSNSGPNSPTRSSEQGIHPKRATSDPETPSQNPSKAEAGNSLRTSRSQVSASAQQSQPNTPLPTDRLSTDQELPNRIVKVKLRINGIQTALEGLRSKLNDEKFTSKQKEEIVKKIENVESTLVLINSKLSAASGSKKADALIKGAENLLNLLDAMLGKNVHFPTHTAVRVGQTRLSTNKKTDDTPSLRLEDKQSLPFQIKQINVLLLRIEVHKKKLINLVDHAFQGGNTEAVDDIATVISDIENRMNEIVPSGKLSMSDVYNEVLEIKGPGWTLKNANRILECLKKLKEPLESKEKEIRMKIGDRATTQAKTNHHSHYRAASADRPSRVEGGCNERVTPEPGSARNIVGVVLPKIPALGGSDSIPNVNQTGLPVPDLGQGNVGVPTPEPGSVEYNNLERGQEFSSKMVDLKTRWDGTEVLKQFNQDEWLKDLMPCLISVLDTNSNPKNHLEILKIIPVVNGALINFMKKRRSLMRPETLSRQSNNRDLKQNPEVKIEKLVISVLKSRMRNKNSNIPPPIYDACFQYMVSKYKLENWRNEVGFSQ